MRIAIIGASGFVGKALLKEFADRNHSIKAIARNIETDLNFKNVVGVKVDIYNTDELVSEIKGADVVVSAFNPGWTNPNIYNDFIKGANSIQEAIKKANINRCILIGGAGSLYLDENTQVIDSPEFPEEIKPGALAAKDYLNELKKDKTFNWVFFSPAIEMHQGTSGTRTGKYKLGLDYPVVNKEGRSILSVEDLAVVIADEVENPSFIRRRFTAGY